MLQRQDLTAVGRSLPVSSFLMRASRGLLTDCLPVFAGLREKLTDWPTVDGRTRCVQQASSYDSYVSRWSRQLAPVFVAWLGIPVGSRWLDVGCGTGALTESILQKAQPAAVVGIDPPPGFIQHLAATCLISGPPFRRRRDGA